MGSTINLQYNVSNWINRFSVKNYLKCIAKVLYKVWRKKYSLNVYVKIGKFVRNFEESDIRNKMHIRSDCLENTAQFQVLMVLKYGYFNHN